MSSRSSGKMDCRAVTAEPTNVAVPSAVIPAMARSGTAGPQDREYGEKVREILRLELEIAADCSMQRCDPSAANILKMLAETTRHVDLAVLLAYARLLDDIRDPAALSDALREIGAGWCPDDAADYVKKLVSVHQAGRLGS
jgi:hypothetical protein